MFFPRLKKRKLAILAALALVVSLTATLIPQNALSYFIVGEIKPPLFTMIPAIPMPGEEEGHEAAEAPEEAPAAADAGAGVGSPEGDFGWAVLPFEDWYRGADDNTAYLFFEPEPYDEFDFELIDMDDWLWDLDPAYDRSLPVLLVKFDPDAAQEQIAELLALYGANDLGRVPDSGIYRIQDAGGLGRLLVEGLKESGLAVSVQRDRRYGPEVMAEAIAQALAALDERLAERALGAAAGQEAAGWIASPIDYVRDETAYPAGSDTETSGWNGSPANADPAFMMTSEEQVQATALELPPKDPEAWTPPLNTPITFESAVLDEYGNPVPGTETQEPVPAYDYYPEPYAEPAPPAVAAPAPPETYQSVEAAPAPSGSDDFEAASQSEPPPEPAVTPDSGISETGDSSLVLHQTVAAEETVTEAEPAPADEISSEETGPLAETETDPQSEVEELELKSFDYAEFTDYYVSLGSVGIRFAASGAPGEELASVSLGDKGFGMEAPADAESRTEPQPVQQSGNSLAYSLANDIITFTPLLSGLLVSIDTYAEVFGLDLPLFGLFAEPAANGIIFINADTGQKAFEIIPGKGAPGGQAIALLELDEAVRLILSSRDETGSQLPFTFEIVPAVVQEKVAGQVIPGPAAGFREYDTPEGYLAVVDLGGGRIYFEPVPGAPDSALSPLTIGDFTEFEGAAGDAGLRFKQVPYGFEQEIVLSEPPAANRFELPVSVEGLFLQQNEGGYIEVLDGEGNQLAVITAPRMYDSRPATRGGPASSTGLLLELVEGKDGWLLAVTADEAWLNDPERVYPVFIDPSVSVWFPNNDMLPTSTPTFFWSTDFENTITQITIGTDPGSKDQWDLHTFQNQVYASPDLGRVFSFTLPATSQ
ncbi:MAG: hypothetical protein IBX61_03295, partial [Thermoleophilia bacterium]|nr:hypothetical protein [Thermoleophilia bacterium]